jgi:uncharacterized protein
VKPLASLLLTACCLAAAATEVIPPAPKQYFNDYANVVAPATAARLNKQLEDFERASSSQVVVAVFPKMESASSLEDYVQRLFQAWQIGQKQKNNGVLLAVFVQDRKLRIHVGYGLEGGLPDALAKRIIDDEITPRFKAGDFDGGLSAGVSAILAATRGEYKGTGRTVAEVQTDAPHGERAILAIALAFGLLVVLAIARGVRRGHRGSVFSGRGYRPAGWSGWDWTAGGSSWSGGSASSGGGSSWSDSGGGFSSGGGDSGGGGASGSW